MTDKSYPGTAYNSCATTSYDQNQQIGECSQYINNYSIPDVNITNANCLNQPASSYDFICNSQMYRSPNVNPSSNVLPNNTYMFCDQNDVPVWMPESRFVADIERGLKFTDRIETIEITSKDLSPASCCSTTDLLLPDFYKGLGKDASYFSKNVDSQWYCGSNYSGSKFNDYPSCAQVSTGNHGFKMERYCSIQKSETNIVNEDLIYANKHLQKSFPSPDLFACEKQVDNPGTLEYFSHCPDVPNFDLTNNEEQHTEISNEGSDIIVEESDEEVTDYSEDHERLEIMATCIICNMLYTPVGNQFYFLTDANPLTMSSQKPVLRKIREILGNMKKQRKFICSHCLGLINTIDHLQIKLESCKYELYTKFEKTCKDNAIDLPHDYKNGKRKITRKKQKTAFKCKTCKKLFSLQWFYRCHIKKHIAKNRYLCETCGVRFTILKKFKQHLKRHKPAAPVVAKVPGFCCNICKKVFRTKSNLKEHFNFCSGLLPYKCKQSNCNKKFPSATKLKNHIKLKHDKKFSAICSICNIGFVKMSDYKLHMVSHSTDKKFHCTKCDKSYKTKNNLNFHMKFHNDKLPFQCTICNKGFMRKEYLEAHVNVHNGIKNFECQLCDKKFVCQKNLDSHMKYHDGSSIPKSMCNICGKEVTSNFEEHLQSHNNLKKFECEKCNIKFNTKGALSKHKDKKHKDK